MISNWKNTFGLHGLYKENSPSYFPRFIQQYFSAVIGVNAMTWSQVIESRVNKMLNQNIENTTPGKNIALCFNV